MRLFNSTALLLLLGLNSPAQTTQALISGRAINAIDSSGIAGASVECQDALGELVARTRTEARGNYVLPPLSPGVYRIRISADQFQPKEFHNLELAVAGRLQLDVRLRPLSDVWEAGQSRSAFFPESEYVTTFHGPDIWMAAASAPAIPGLYGVLEAAISQVVNSDDIRALPLAGRDVYTLLAIQPGVTSDAGTARSLGLSTAGQRPSSTNFLLDGLEANQHLLSGPILAASTEAIQEYRISASSYTAEFGGTSGFIANAITTGGSNAWHGALFANWKNSLLNANGFQENRSGLERAALHEIQPGARMGGPIRRDRLFVSGAFELLRSRSHARAIDVSLPGPGVQGIIAPDSIAHALLQRFPSPVPPEGNSVVVHQTVRPPVSINRTFALGRADLVVGRSRIMTRVVDGRESRPDFIWSPYRDFVSGLNQPATSLAFRVTTQATSRIFHELRTGISHDDLRWQRAHPEIPTLIESTQSVILPGSLAFYGFRNHGTTYQAESQFLVSRGSHILKFGGGLFQRRLTGFLNAGEAGRYVFSSLFDFTIASPREYTVAVDRAKLPVLQAPDFSRAYRYWQGSAYVQEDWRASRRISFNLGIRYEYSGAPVNTGSAPDLKIRLGSGPDLAAQISGAELAVQNSSRDSLFSPSNNFAPRTGIALLLGRDGRTVLRGAWGIYFDRAFDNLWQGLRNNRMALATFAPPRQTDYLRPAADAMAGYPLVQVSRDFPNITMIDTGWKNGRVLSHFIALERQIRVGWVLQAQISGNRGDNLVTTDVVNRPFTLTPEQAGRQNNQRRINPQLPLIAYRGNQGYSTYHALTGSATYRGRVGWMLLGYTWARAIDNQSDALAGDFFDLSFAQIGPPSEYRATAAFTRQFDTESDRGDSDFDQRHNFVVQSLWHLPAGPPRLRKLLEGWTVSEVAAFRTGLPVTVYAASPVPVSGGTILNARADLVGAITIIDRAIPGGFQLFDATQFRDPPPGSAGTLGRNALRGPGMFNLDASLSRAFRASQARENMKMILRMDAFNLLNHANLNPPDISLHSPTFGEAMFGRDGRSAGFPALIPFRETARQLQVILRIEF
jgi:hypothetical protein